MKYIKIFVSITILVVSLISYKWCRYRNEKYPVHEEYWLENKFIIPSFILNRRIAQVTNKIVRFINKHQTLQGIERKYVEILSSDGYSFNISILYLENDDSVQPCLIYYHGNGFVLEEFPCMINNVVEYMKVAHCKVVFVHYRTIDSNPFDATINDGYSALNWIYNHADEYNIDKNRIAVGGDSSGGFIAAKVTHFARNLQGPPICFQMLIYPLIDVMADTETNRKYTDSPIWNSKMTKKIIEIYMDDKTAVEASLLNEERYDSLPDAYIEVEEFDCLHDEGIEYAKKLMKGGSKVQLIDAKGTFHGFDSNLKKETAKFYIQKRGETLKNVFNS